MAEWTVDTVAERFAEAAETARRLPPVRVQGYFNLWPPIRRQPWEALGASDVEPRPLPPSPAAIEQMLETMQWVQWLDVEQRHLVWMRATDIGGSWSPGVTPAIGRRRGGGGGEPLNPLRPI